MLTSYESAARFEVEELAESETGEDGEDDLEESESDMSSDLPAQYLEQEGNFASLQEGYDDDAALHEALRLSIASVLACIGGHQRPLLCMLQPHFFAQVAPDVITPTKSPDVR